MNLLDLPGYLTSRKSFHLMSSQALTGIAFDKEAAEKLVVRIQHEMQEIEQDVEPTLPPCPLNKGETKEFTVPAKPFKKDGTLSATMEKFLSKHGLTAHREGDNVPYIQWVDGSFHTIEAGYVLPATKPMHLGNQDDLKDWLLEKGWKPTLFNLKKGPNGKPERDKKTGGYIKTSPKMQDQGRLCPNLEALDGDLVRSVVRWLSLRNRLSVVSGWLEDPRLAFDGCLSAGSAGITNTFRQKHTTVVNLPKAEDGVTLGKEVRSLFVARAGRVLVGYDASALENRMEAHYVYRYPGGVEYGEEILSGDPHKKNAFVFYPDALALLRLEFDTTDKEIPAFKPFRSKSKNGKYCLTYGGSGRKLAATLGLPEHMGDSLYEAFWQANKPLALLKQALELFWETTGQKKWVKGLDGRRVYTRSRHSLVNALFQSAGAIIMDTSILYMDKWLGGISVDSEGTPCYHYKGHTIYRVAYQHDELQWDCPSEIAEEIGRMGCKSIEQTGRYYKMKVALAGEWKAGKNWSEVH